MEANRRILTIQESLDNHLSKIYNNEIIDDPLAKRAMMSIFSEFGENLKWDDREFVSKCIKQNGNLIKLASDELRNDRELLIEAVNNGLEVPSVGPKMVSCVINGRTFHVGEPEN